MAQVHAVLGVVAASLFCGVSAGLGAERAVVSLGGTWQRATTQEAADAPPAGGWEQIQAPSTTWQVPVGGTHYVWYQREVEIPAGAEGGKVFVDLRGARYLPRVYVDGKYVGAGSDGWSPTVVEITSAVTPGKPCKLAIRCADRGAFLTEGFVLQSGMSEEQQRGKTLAPVGGYKESMGLWDRVLLRVTPGEYVDTDELVIVPSTRKSMLSLSGKAAAQEAVIAAEVIDGDKVVLNLPAAQVGQDGTWSLSGAFADARCWSPEDPHLYSLRLTLRKGENGPVLDQVTQRFGFKEIWTEGPDFYLNGVKRHLLGTSTWPNQGFEDAADIRKRVQFIKDSNAVAFRPHTCPWQEAWMDAADELGLLMIGEAAVYTDGSGIYGYTDPRFWENYRKHVEGMIKRDRNRASLVMWSLGNEILFMNAQRFDKDLPKKLGDLARFAKTVDPHHPYTFEADVDPDGAYDVIGLHYPHEMPSNRDYPNTADWITRRIEAEAGGGMLGQRTSDFFWDRKKPLYIGEYLWVPQDDYSVGTIWFGDEAMTNRNKYHQHAQLRAWYDQTIAYRRAGVSGMCPWSPLDFGATGSPTPEHYQIQQEFYRPVAAFMRNRGLRHLTGDTARLVFDVFNDSARPAALELQLHDPTGETVASQKLTLEPAGYAPVTLEHVVAAGDTQPLTSVLMADGKPVHTQQHTLRAMARQEISAPPGKKLVVYDPTGKWAGSVKTLDGLGEPAGTILVLAPDALQPGAKPEVPTIGGGTFDSTALLQFLSRGGRAVVLEQPDLSALGLGLSLRDSTSTMAFAVHSDHPIVQGIGTDGLSWWGEDNYVSRKQIVRPASGGARAIAVTGGPDWLGNAPIVEMPVGNGHLVLIQALAGAKMKEEPAAQRIVQNAVTYLAQLPPATAQRTAVFTTSADFIGVLRKLGIASSPQVGDARVTILHGADDAVFAAEEQLKQNLSRGGTVYWHAPTPEAFAMLRKTLGAPNLRVRAMPVGVSLANRDAALLMGVSREDVLCTSKPQGWDRKMQYLPQAAGIVVEADRREEAGARVAAASAKLQGAQVRDGKAMFDRRGTARFTVASKAEGIHALTVRAGGTKQNDEFPVLMLEVNGEEVCWFGLDSTDVKGYAVQAKLRKGDNDVAVRFLNGSEWGGGRALTLESVEVGSEAGLGEGVEALTLPAAVVTWQVGPGRVVIDGINWDKPWPGMSDPKRFATALLANVGATFSAPISRVQRDAIPLGALQLIGESPYFGRADDQLSCYNNATFETPFECNRTDSYKVRVTARGTHFKEVMPRVLVSIDGKQVGLLEINAMEDQSFVTESVRITQGRHTLRLVYDNDASDNRQDRNLFLRRVEFER